MSNTHMRSNIVNGKSTKKPQLKTTETETLIQRIARNVAWHALRIARPHLFKHKSHPISLVCLSDACEARQWVHVMETHDPNVGERPPVPLGHVIFRG